MAALNFNRIPLMLKDTGSIPWETLHSQDGLNLGDIRFCPLRKMLHMQHLSLNWLWKLIAEGAFMLPQLEGPPELSGTTADLLVFQADSQHEEITDVYVGLIVHRIKSHLYALDQILDFIKDIEVNLQVACDALKAGGDPGKRRAFCLFVSNFGGTMSNPTDLPYCLVYPTSYIRDADPDHFDTCKNLAGTCLCHCICCATLQYNNDEPKEHTNYAGSCLILPHGAQYNDQLFPTILEPRNHCSLLIDSTMREPYPMEMVGDFWAVDSIFKGCYGDSVLYSDADLHWLRWWGIHLPAFQGEIPVPPAPSYQQVRELTATKQSPHRAAASDTPAESPKAKRSSSKSSPQRGSGRSSNTSTPKCPDSISAKKPSCPKEPTLNGQEKSPKSHSSHKCGRLPSPTAESVRCKWRDFCMEDLPISSSMFDGFCSPTGSFSDMTKPLPPSITLTPLGQASLRHGHTTSADSRHLTASRFTSLNFNLPGYPAVRLGSLTPSVPSIAGSHHMSSTWPPSLFTSGPSTPRLTIDEANSIFSFASECLSVSQASECQGVSCAVRTGGHALQLSPGDSA